MGKGHGFSLFVCLSLTAAKSVKANNGKIVNNENSGAVGIGDSEAAVVLPLYTS
jgi:hypothetical protein